MKSIINLFWGICLLRQSPSVVPGQGWFVALVVVANLLVGLIVLLPLADSPGVEKILTGLAVGAAVTASLFWLVLGARDVPERFTTAIAAFFGCELLISLCFSLTLPVLLLLGLPAVLLALLAFTVWLVTVTGYILHRAAEVTLPIGIGLAIGIRLLGGAASQLVISA
jgi:hypothetical protein